MYRTKKAKEIYWGLSSKRFFPRLISLDPPGTGAANLGALFVPVCVAVGVHAVRGGLGDQGSSRLAVDGGGELGGSELGVLADVSVVEELDEEEEVGEVHEEGRGEVFVGDRARAALLLVRVGREVDVEPEDHLHDLERAKHKIQH